MTFGGMKLSGASAHATTLTMAAGTWGVVTVPASATFTLAGYTYTTPANTTTTVWVGPGQTITMGAIVGGGLHAVVFTN